MKAKLFHVITLGCRVNQYESLSYVSQLEKLGWEMAERDVDLCILNACSVTYDAERSSIHKLRSFLKKSPRAKVAITGCLIIEAKEKIKKHLADKEIIIIPNKDKERLVEKILNDLFNEQRSMERDFFRMHKNISCHTRAFIKIQDGCDGFCSYCIIPFLRGAPRSRKADEILDEIRNIVKKGCREVVLTGIHIGKFSSEKILHTGKKASFDLADLLYDLEDIKGLERVRISSIRPDEIGNKLFDAIIACRKVCSNMHIVLQSGSDKILKMMNRKYTYANFFSLVERFMNNKTDFSITTDIIVGFPSETEEDFEKTRMAIAQIPFAKVHIFPYSERPFTKAVKMKGKVSNEVIAIRKNILLQDAKEVSKRFKRKFIGRIMKVLVESTKKDSEYIGGYTDNFLHVLIPKKDLTANDILLVKIESMQVDNLIGRVV